VRIAITVLVCIVLFGLGFFHYEYSRLQKDQSAAYTDEYVAKLKAEEDNSSVAKSAEEDMEKNLADVAEADTVKAEGEIFQDSSVYNILLIGTDDRTEKFSTDARGDTCILLSINKNTGKVTLASFERGTGVPVLWGPYEGQWDWLTHTFRYGGAQMMVEEIRDNYLVDVNRYIRINIRTLVKLIDAIGGVDIDLTEAEANHLDNPEGTFTEGYAKGIGMEDKEQFDLTAGVNHLNGVTAMVYARTRYIDDDWHRVQRQRKVIMAAAEKLSKLSASEMISTLDAVIPLVQTDLSETEVAELLTLAPVFMGAEIQQITIPADGTYGSMKGMDGRSMYAVDFNANAKILKEMLYGITDEEAEEQVNEEGGTAATDYTNTSRTSGYVSDESVTAEDAQNAQAAKAAQDTEAANAVTSSTSSTTGSGTSSGTTSSSTSLQQQTATQEVEQAMNVPQTTTTDTQNAAAGTSDAAAAGTDAAGTATVGTGVSAAAGDSATDYAALQAQYQQQADSLNQAATANQAAATQAAAQALDESLSDEERAAAQEQANQLAVQAQQQAVAAQQAQVQANAAAAQAAAGTGDGSAAGN
jgi:LCP family protein required for cell wall assembly